MSYVFYEAYNPDTNNQQLLDKIITIILDYRQQGFTLTLRQLYYQLVSKDFIRNTIQEYKHVGMLVSRGRLGGLLDWDAIEDRVRVADKPPEFSSLDSLVRAAFNSFRLPRLVGQEQLVELWVEKDALAGVLEPIANEYHITLMVNRGYSSTSAMRESGLRVRADCAKIGADHAVILYLGDMDPSGEDMVRDVQDRLDQFVNQGITFTMEAGRPWRGGEVTEESAEDRRRRMPPISIEVRKLALTMDQVEEHQPPPNPVKTTDGRATKYIEKHGEESWEVDALPPVVLRDIIEQELEGLLDMEKIEAVKETEDLEKNRLRAALESLSKSTEPTPPPVKSRKKKR